MINNDAIAFASYINPVNFKFHKSDLQVIVTALKSVVHDIDRDAPYQTRLAHRTLMYGAFNLARRLSDSLLRNKQSYTVRLTPFEVQVVQSVLIACSGNVSAQVIYGRIHQKTFR